MFDFKNGIAEPLSFYLCKPDDTIICELNGINRSTAEITLNINNLLELSFDDSRFIDINGELVESNEYSLLNIGMQILVDKVGFFKIKYPPYSYDGQKEIKKVTASSIECELEDKSLINFKINTGEKDSQENLVTYDDDEDEILESEYNGIPFDYIVIDNTFASLLQKIVGKYTDDTTYTDDDSLEELDYYFSLIPRLIRKTNKDENDEISITEYAERKYNLSGELTSVYLFPGFNNRITKLKTFYTKYKHQLSLLSLAVEKCNCSWKVGEMPTDVANMKFQFSSDSTNIYSFLTNEVASVTKCMIDFDRFTRTFKLIPIGDIGEDSAVIIDRENLLKSLDVSCNEENLITRYNVSGADDLPIEDVNFGSNRIIDLTYFINTKDLYGQRVYVSDELATRYAGYLSDREIARQYYTYYSKEYALSLLDIDAIKYKEFAGKDALKTDWDTFQDDELEAELVGYNSLLASCKSLYKEDYASYLNEDGSINENHIKTTEYWYDYYAYQKVIEQIEEVIVAHGGDKKYADIDNKEILAKVNAWKTLWDLFGTVELLSKIKAYDNVIKLAVDEKTIEFYDSTRRTWSSLTDEQKESYCNLESYYYSEPMAWNNVPTAKQADYGSLNIDYNARYTELKKSWDDRLACQKYLDSLLTLLSTAEATLSTAQSRRVAIAKYVDIDNYNRTLLRAETYINNEYSSIPTTANAFTDNDKKLLNRLLIDGSYSNSNILITNLDTYVTKIDAEEELYQDAVELLSIKAQPQISFSANTDNLFAIKEFENFNINVGNYIYVQYYDDSFIQLRLSSIKFNPCEPTDKMLLEFTNYITSNAERTDLTYLLDGMSGGGGSSSGGSSSGSGNGNGVYGESDDIDITISNTMLTKLLNTETFGTRVTDVILDTVKANDLTARFAKFGGLANGTTTIDGACIKTGAIMSEDCDATTTLDSDGYYQYNLDNTKGSIISLKNGEMNFGGGKFTLLKDEDGLYLLTVKGKIEADDGHIGGWNIDADSIYKTIEFVKNSSTKEYYTAELYAPDNGTENDIAFKIIKRVKENGTYKTPTYPFKVLFNGKLYSENADIAGKITATSGNIGMFLINERTGGLSYSNSDGKNSLIMENYYFRMNFNSDDVMLYADDTDGYRVIIKAKDKIKILSNNISIGETITSYTNYNISLNGKTIITDDVDIEKWLTASKITSGREGSPYEHQVVAKSASGDLYLFCQGSATGSRGIYSHNAAGTEKGIIIIDLNNTATLYGNCSGSAGSVAWGNVSGKPSTYPPSSHGTHVPGIKSATAPTTSGWGTNNNYVPDMSFMAYWNGAYYNTSSNLEYCKKGAFGTIITKSTSDYATASHSHHQLIHDTYHIEISSAGNVYPSKSGTATAGYCHLGSSSAYWGKSYSSSWTTASDSREKVFIENLSEEETQIVLLNYKARKFYRKEDEHRVPRYGAFAQDIRDTLRDNNIGLNSVLSIGTIDGAGDDVYDLDAPEDLVRYAVDYNSLVTPLIKGWQMHLKKIEELENRIKELEMK